MAKKYIVDLSEAEVAQVRALIKTGKRKARTITRAYILLLANEVGLTHLLFSHDWSNSRGTPASTYLTQTTKSSFICCHYQYRSGIFWLSAFYDLFDLLLKVFLKASCSCGSALTWQGLGTILRH